MAGTTDATKPVAPEALSAITRAALERDLYIDRLRSIMTALVVLHHAAITYGAPGGWFYNELKPSGSVTSFLLTLFVATNQAYFMGFFFLLAGYFTPGSLERKGYGRFIGDRFLRLGLPLLAFILILGPLTESIVTWFEGKGFWSTVVWLWNHHAIGNGPLWFAQALLMFGLGYCIWRLIFGAALQNSARKPAPLPSYTRWLISAVAVGATALGIRQFVPTGVNIIGLQLGYCASYVFLFAIGIATWRYDWLGQLQWKNVRPWIVTLFIAWPSMPLAIILATKLNGHGKSNFGGGLTWPAIWYAFWEPFVAWGLIGAWLLIARTHMNLPSQFWAWLNRGAYAVYIIHPPILVGITLLFHAWIAPALLKFAVTGTLACIACWLIADLLVRAPGLRRVI